MLTCDRSLSTALLARYSCTNPSIVLPTTTASTITASVHSPTKLETVAAKMRMRTSGLLNWLTKRPSAVARRFAASAFGPYCLARASASALARPRVELPRSESSRSARRLQ